MGTRKVKYDLGWGLKYCCDCAKVYDDTHMYCPRCNSKIWGNFDIYVMKKMIKVFEKVKETRKE